MTDPGRPVVLAAAPLPPGLMERLHALFEVRIALAAPDRAERLARIGAGVRGAVVSGSHGLSLHELQTLPDLEVVTVFGVGLDAIDLDHLRSRGVAVATAPVLAEDVADLAVALWLAAGRRVAAADRYVREGRWAASGHPPLTRRASGRRMGVFGFGRIGQAIARRIAPFASEVLYTSRRPRQGSAHAYVEGLHALADACEVLFIAAPAGPETRGVVDSRVLDALGPQGVLVNVARGSLVDELALVAALREGRLGAAGLDVFADEPHPRPELLDLPNAVLSPHMGSATVECRADMAACVVANLQAVFAGEPLPTPYG
jgi:hydroxypyruvate reductase